MTDFARAIAPILAALLADPAVANALRNALHVDEPQRPVEEPGLLSKSQIARALGVSTPTIDRHDLAGAPFVQVASRKKYDLEARRAWLKERGRFISAPKKAKPVDTIDVSDVVRGAGLRVVR